MNSDAAPSYPILSLVLLAGFIEATELRHLRCVCALQAKSHGGQTESANFGNIRKVWLFKSEFDDGDQLKGAGQLAIITARQFAARRQQPWLILFKTVNCATLPVCMQDISINLSLKHCNGSNSSVSAAAAT